jgi:hypothetical protein
VSHEDEDGFTNPLFGYSEGAVQKKLFQKELTDYYNRSQKSQSLSRSRSKSKVAKL